MKLLRIGLLTLFWGIVCVAQAEPAIESPYVRNLVETATEALSQPVVVSRTNGSAFEGYFQSKSKEGFTLFQDVGADGSVEVYFSKDEVYLVEFAGDALYQDVNDLFDAQDYQSVAQVGSLMFKLRLPFVQFLREKDVASFAMLAESFVLLGKATDALGVIRGIKPYLSDPEYVDPLEDIELLTYLSLDLTEEAVSLARRKIESAKDPSMGTLAWVALSFHHLNASRYREAWLAAVHPILFDRRKDSNERSDAYLAAMVACLKQNRPTLALDYYRKWQKSGLTLVEKPYQKAWLEWWKQVDWQSIEEDASGMEAFADIESAITPHTDIDPSMIPILNIPIR